MKCFLFTDNESTRKIKSGEFQRKEHHSVEFLQSYFSNEDLYIMYVEGGGIDSLFML